ATRASANADAILSLNMHSPCFVFVIDWRTRLWPRCSSGASQPTSVHHQRVSGDVACAMRAQEGHRCDNVVRLADAAERKTFGCGLKLGLGIEGGAVEVGEDRSRCNCVDADSVWRELSGRRDGELTDTALG